MSDHIYDLVAREKYNLPDQWRWMAWKAIGRHDRADGVMVTGAVMPRKTRGKYKGNFNWLKRDKKTEMTVFISNADVEAYNARWEITTGKCHVCRGGGQSWCGWSKADGNKFTPCERCEATGIAPKLVGVAHAEAAA